MQERRRSTSSNGKRSSQHFHQMWFKGQLQLFLTWALSSYCLYHDAWFLYNFRVQFEPSRGSAQLQNKPSTALQLYSCKQAASNWKSHFVLQWPHQKATVVCICANPTDNSNKHYTALTTPSFFLSFFLLFFTSYVDNNRICFICT